MSHDNFFSVAAARVLHLPFRLVARKPFTPPKKAVILQPCCMSQVMLTTPLLAAMSSAFPEARFDWVVSEWARPAIAGNPRLKELIDAGPANIKSAGYSHFQDLAARLRQEEYDTCIIPSRSGMLSFLPWRAGIPQRIGLNVSGRGFAHTIAVKPDGRLQHASDIYLSLAAAMGIELGQQETVGMEFYPPDSARTKMTHRLVEDLDWLGDRPLVIIHPGGASNPLEANPLKRWPAERFVRLANYLAGHHNARVLLVGAEADKPLATAVSGMMSHKATNWAGQVNLGELGALCEVADLYVGNDTGPTHIAAAVGCPTLAIFGPSNPAYSRPYGTKGKVTVLWQEVDEDEERPFSWDTGISVEETVQAAKAILQSKPSEHDLSKLV